MISNKSKKVIGIGLIVSGIIFYYVLLATVIGISTLTDMTLMNFFKSIIHFLFDALHFHILAFVLIVLGIICLWKSKHLKIKETVT